MNAYEAERAANIKKNKELLIALGLEEPVIYRQPTKGKNKNAPAKKKRKAAPASSEESEEPPAKMNKAQVSGDAEDKGTRRSTRHAGKPKISYNESRDQPFNYSFIKSRMPRVVASVPSEREYVGNRLGKRTYDPKTFGAIPGIEVGTWWESRALCSTDAVHAPFVAGIAGTAADGAYSVALSGGYDDDVDLGYAFTYTGSGGRDLKGTKANPKNLRTAPQSHDQTFTTTMNAALKVSAKTKRPVRVIRGYKLNSPYAPASGYRYDGLYIVQKAWRERGLNPHGYKVCKYAFKRMEGQPPLVIGKSESDSGGDGEEQN